MDFLKQLNIHSENSGTSTGSNWMAGSAKPLDSFSPVDGKRIASVTLTGNASYNEVVEKAQKAFQVWSTWPAPKRGEMVRQIGEALREKKTALGRLVSYEMGKSLQEGLGEVQEMIDICDFAVGLSRQLHGFTMHSERPRHRMYEQWHPMGVVGIISAFNFPVAVWSWNSMLAWVCGNVCIWKGSEKTPLCSVACQQIVSSIFEKNEVPEGTSCLITGDREAGEWMGDDSRISLVSATGSTRMGKALGAQVAGRMGKSLLELGGNNA
ncbi:MAG TPA: aldehyde dehydrogenase family protein, partial [Puia sp.]